MRLRFLSFSRFIMVSVVTLTLSACSHYRISPSQLGRVDNHTIEFAFQKNKSPTIIFIHGGGPVKLHTWAHIYNSLGKEYSVFAYNRFGRGRSTNVRTPQSAERVTSTLHKFLRHENIVAPYILVGHSLGGLYANLYARKYPNEVAGVVMVDPSHPDQFKIFGQHGLSPNVMTRIILKMYKKYYPAHYSEVSTFPRAAKQIARAGRFPNIPLAVITAGKRGGSTKLHKVILDMHRELASLSPRSILIKASESGHNIQKNQPDLVIKAIKWVIANR